MSREGVRAVGVRGARFLRRHIALTVLLVVVAEVARRVHHPGHSWGDDFALYLRQAKSLVDGNMHQIVADTRFTVQASGKPDFSPGLYPWGFPIMLAPFVWRWGIDYTHLKLVMVGIFVAYLWVYHRVLIRRTHPVVAFGVAASIGTTLVYLRHTDYLLSELPYMLASALALWSLDRSRRHSRMHDARTSTLVWLGLAALLVFNTRREGVAILPAVALAQVIDLRGHWRTFEWRQRWKHLATPWFTIIGGSLALQLLLPNPLAQSYDKSGLSQTWKKFTGPWHRDFAVELGMDHLRGFWLGAMFALVLIGIVVACVRAPSLNVPLAVFAVGSMLVVGTIPAISPRYLMSITPFAVFFASQALAGLPLPKRAGVWATAVALALLTYHHLTLLPTAVRATDATNRQTAVAEGPESAWVTPVWDAVQKFTHEGDVVAFWRARLMSLYTDRRSIQTYSIEVMNQKADFYMMRRDWTFFQPLVSDSVAKEMGWTMVWSNERWVLWQVRQPHT